jgi:predicted DNA-binding transcriptional regulator AlpA
MVPRNDATRATLIARVAESKSNEQERRVHPNNGGFSDKLLSKLVDDWNAGAEADESDRLVNVETAADLLACSKRHVWVLANLGKLPRVRLSTRCVRFRMSDVQQIIQEGVK